MNYNISKLINEPIDLPPYTKVILEQPSGINYTELGIFISGIILSLGGCFAVVSSHCRRSNCKTIDCCCIKIQREDMDIEEP